MRFLPFAFKSLSRNPVRATLTLLGVSVAMFLFTGVVSIDQGMRRMLANSIAPHVTLELAFLAVALAGVLGTIAAVLPAISASRLKIVQALREVD
jgi:ABC-type antimicrobial peptide transport system permease subunit